MNFFFISIINEIFSGVTPVLLSQNDHIFLFCFCPGQYNIPTPQRVLFVCLWCLPFLRNFPFYFVSFPSPPHSFVYFPGFIFLFLRMWSLSCVISIISLQFVGFFFFFAFRISSRVKNKRKAMLKE